jgi:hypothetical protein
VACDRVKPTYITCSVNFILRFYYEIVFQCVDPFVLYVSSHKYTIRAINLLLKKYDKTELGLRTISTSCYRW